MEEKIQTGTKVRQVCQNRAVAAVLGKRQTFRYHLNLGAHRHSSWVARAYLLLTAAASVQVAARALALYHLLGLR